MKPNRYLLLGLLWMWLTCVGVAQADTPGTWNQLSTEDQKILQPFHDRWDNLPLVSLGLSAQGYAPRTAYHNVGAIKPYYQLLDAGRLPIATVDYLTPELELIREVASRLRFTRLDVGAIQRKYGVDLDYVFGDLIGALVGHGYLQRQGDEISMTGKACYYNNIIPMLFAPDS